MRGKFTGELAPGSCVFGRSRIIESTRSAWPIQSCCHSHELFVNCCHGSGSFCRMRCSDKNRKTRSDCWLLIIQGTRQVGRLPVRHEDCHSWRHRSDWRDSLPRLFRHRRRGCAPDSKGGDAVVMSIHPMGWKKSLRLDAGTRRRRRRHQSRGSKCQLSLRKTESARDLGIESRFGSRDSSRARKSKTTAACLAASGDGNDLCPSI